MGHDIALVCNCTRCTQINNNNNNNNNIHFFIGPQVSNTIISIYTYNTYIKLKALYVYIQLTWLSKILRDTSCNTDPQIKFVKMESSDNTEPYNQNYMCLLMSI